MTVDSAHALVTLRKMSGLTPASLFIPLHPLLFPFLFLSFFFPKLQDASMHVFMFCKKELFLLLMLSSIMIIICVRDADLYKQAVVKCTWEGQNDRRDAADHASS